MSAFHHAQRWRKVTKAIQQHSKRKNGLGSRLYMIWRGYLKLGQIPYLKLLFPNNTALGLSPTVKSISNPINCNQDNLPCNVWFSNETRLILQNVFCYKEGLYCNIWSTVFKNVATLTFHKKNANTKKSQVSKKMWDFFVLAFLSCHQSHWHIPSSFSKTVFC